MSDKQLKIKSATSVKNIIMHLESLIESFKKGNLTILSNNKALIIQPQGPIRFDMEAEVGAQKSGAHQKLSVKLKWQRKPDTWPSIIHAPEDNPATDKSATGARPLPEDIIQPQQESIDEDVCGKDQQIKLSQNEARAQKKPRRKNQSKKSASAHTRKTRS